MAKAHSSSYVVLISILFNLVLIFKLYVRGEWKLSWSTTAAQEAEYLAAIPCSGHGRAYLDGLVLDGKERICECNPCYGGPHCSQFSTGCTANADGGDPYFLEPFWMQHAAKSAILVAGWHRMGYSYPDGSYISNELEWHIRKLHATVGNAVTQGRYIIFGAGSSQLLNAALHALSSNNFNSSPASVVVSVPYYELYQKQTEFFGLFNCKFEGDAALFQNSSDAATANVIEFVTSPNNPDGQLNKAIFQGPNCKAIYDRVYYWPYFTGIPAPADDDLMIFTISKLTGHAGSRFGWAVVKDEAVYQKMSNYMSLSSFGVSRDAQLRALKLLNVVLETGGKQIFEFGYNTLRNRWEKLSNTLSMSNRFSLQKIAPKYCTFFQKVRGPSPAYAWVKCEREEDEDCYAVLQEEGNINGRRGSRFGAEDGYVRLSLIRSEDDFGILLHRLNQLVLEESYTAKNMSNI